MTAKRAGLPRDLTDADLLDPDVWEVPDHLTEADCLFETGCDGLRFEPRRNDEEDR